MTRKVRLKVLPGEPLDGSGKVCHHLFVRNLDEKSGYKKPYTLKTNVGGPIIIAATRGHLACDPKRVLTPTSKGGVTEVTLYSDDPRAVNCPKCQATEPYKQLMRLLSGVPQEQPTEGE